MAKVRTRKRGKTYSYIFEAGQQNGKRKVIEKGGFPTQAAAYEAGAEAFTSWKHGNIGITSERTLLSDFANLWLNHAAQNIRMSTVVSYKTILSSQILPALGGTVVQDLTPAAIEAWVTNLYARGYSKGYMKQSRMILKAVLDYAVYPAGLISSNPCLYIKVPKKAPTQIVKRTIITDEQYHELLKKYPPGHDMHMPIVLLYHTGMRIGELLGLLWSDIDFDRHTLTIRRQRIYNSDKDKPHNRLTEPKTAKSQRVIYISDALIAELRAEQECQQMMDFDIETAIDTDGFCYTYSKGLGLQKALTAVSFVCVTQNGKPVNRRTVIKCMHENGINSHSFRHTQATRLAAANVPPVTAARRLGHSTVDLTLNLYTHDTDELQREAAEALEKL